MVFDCFYGVVLLEKITVNSVINSKVSLRVIGLFYRKSPRTVIAYAVCCMLDRYQ